MEGPPDPFVVSSAAPKSGAGTRIADREFMKIVHLLPETGRRRHLEFTGVREIRAEIVQYPGGNLPSPAAFWTVNFNSRAVKSGISLVTRGGILRNG